MQHTQTIAHKRLRPKHYPPGAAAATVTVSPCHVVNTTTPQSVSDI